MVEPEPVREPAWQIFKKDIRDTVKLFVPLSTVRAPKDPKWLTREIVKLTRKKKRHEKPTHNILAQKTE